MIAAGDFSRPVEGLSVSAVDFPFGEHPISMEIAEECLGEIVAPRPVAPAPDPAAAIEEALERPIGTSPLSGILHPGKRAAVVIDDITRKTPTRRMLPPVLDRLIAAGIPPGDIAIVIALGTHRPMTEGEILEKVGSDVARTFPIVNLPARGDTPMVHLGTSSGGIPVWVNRTVAEAGIRIGLGMIVPHLDVGYGGGSKIILPGVCGPETVAAFHARTARAPSNPLGVAETSLRLDLEAFVSEYVGLDFILNAVLTPENELYRCVAGDPRLAHRTGIQYAREVYEVPVKRQYPIVIASAHPYEMDLWQATKALASGERMTTRGGTLILVAACPEGTGPHPLFATYMGYDLERLLDLLDRGMIEDVPAAAEAAAVCRMRQRLGISLVSSGLGEQDAEGMGMTCYPTVEAALSEALRQQEEKKVGVLTHGGTLLPILQEADL